jgi:NTP pyrophosphatase (non-canonical NTP hydrolase)
MSEPAQSDIESIKQALRVRTRTLDARYRTQELGELLLFLVGLADLHQVDLFDAGRAALDAQAALQVPGGHA